MQILRTALATVAFVASPAAFGAACAGFDDVSDSDPFCGYVEWVKNRNITLGCAPGLYCPYDNVTRLQMAAFLNRLGNVTFQQGGNAFGATAVLGTTDGQGLELHAGGRRAMRFEGFMSPNVIGGYAGNTVGSGVRGATVGGGGYSGSQPVDSSPNYVWGDFGTVGGGAGNQAGSPATLATNATVAGGRGNDAMGSASTIAGGSGGLAAGDYSFIGGGQNNMTTGQDSFVGGGRSNAALGLGSTVLSGDGSTALGDYSFAMGRRAKALLPGCHVWSDGSHDTATTCLAPNEYVARALGGFSFWTSGSSDETYAGARLASGAGAWAAHSDRNGKHDVQPVDVRQVLDHVVDLPVATWQWKAEAGDVRHMGPMAQDFHAAFGLGSRDTEIVTVDADGVALAAIQGLNAKLEERLAAKDAEITVLRAEVAELRALRAEVAELRSLRAEVAAMHAALPSAPVTASAGP